MKKIKLSAVAFAELVVYIEDARSKESIAPVFKLADLAQLYRSRLQQLGVISETRMHTTRLKQKLLARFPDMRAQIKGRDVLLAFDEDVGHAISKACDYDDDDDAVLLARAAQIVRRTCLIQVSSLVCSMKIAKKILCHLCCLH